MKMKNYVILDAMSSIVDKANKAKELNLQNGYIVSNGLECFEVTKTHKPAKGYAMFSCENGKLTIYKSN